MTTDELNALSELAVQFRTRSGAASRIRDEYLTDAARLAFGSPRRDTLKMEAERLEGKRQAYANDADDLERFIRTFAPAAEASEKGGE